jgi:lipopolysaccharide/colanic/teichoic acid biosynthesis glycosyltransferase
MRATRLSDGLKRVIDVAVAGLVLATTAPLQGAIAIAVAHDLGRPVLFRQERPGRRGQPFTLVKFRTMREPVPGATDDAARLTRLGRTLRATSLDELPTLWNVLRGDMSLVGPRPLLMEYLDRYTPEQARRHEVRPGVTGLAQVNGRNALDWADRFQLDVWYVDHRSLALDLQILTGTVATVLARRGISAQGQATAAEFRGTTKGANL